MGIYLARRLLQTVSTLFLASIGFFLLIHFEVGPPCAPAAVGCREALDLNAPISTQYVVWASHLVRGDFGTSIGGQPVTALILQRLPPTILLVGVAFIVQQMIALPLGVLAATRQYSRMDGAFTVGSYIALSLPAFVVGLLLIYFFSVQWGLLPVGHVQDYSVPLFWSSDWFVAAWHDPTYVLGDLVRHLALPALVLAVTGIAIDSRFMRSAMLQVLSQDYIRTAKAKGVPRRLVVFKHAFRNALPPIVTNIGLYLPSLIGGVLVVELVFSWDGLGYLFDASTGRSLQLAYGGPFTFFSYPDMPTLQALLILSIVATLLANLLADLAYAWLDPRIRYKSRSGG